MKFLDFASRRPKSDAFVEADHVGLYREYPAHCEECIYGYQQPGVCFNKRGLCGVGKKQGAVSGIKQKPDGTVE